MSDKTVLLIEAFYGGSHKQLIDLILRSFSDSAVLYSLPAKKWHWRNLISALHFADVIPKEHKFSVLFSSSVLPLAELLAVRPDLSKLHKVVYFHENQMVYPVQEEKKRYFQHAYNEVLTCLAADKVVFNSNFNKESFLTSISTLFRIVPDPKPRDLEKKIRPKCSVLYFPLSIPHVCIASQNLYHGNKETPERTGVVESMKKNRTSEKNGNSNSLVTIQNKTCNLSKEKLSDKLHIVWPHRWEYDKDPETFFQVIFKLKEQGLQFNLSILGESYSEKPAIFAEAADYLKEHIINFGFKDSKEEYYSVLSSADVVVSTAVHEFFGVSMLEASMCGCFPLCPRRLVYPEIYPDICLYSTPNQLFKKLRDFCQRPWVLRKYNVKMTRQEIQFQTLAPCLCFYLIEQENHPFLFWAIIDLMMILDCGTSNETATLMPAACSSSENVCAEKSMSKMIYCQ